MPLYKSLAVLLGRYANIIEKFYSNIVKHG